MNDIQNLNYSSFGIYIVSWQNIDNLDYNYKNPEWKEFIANAQISDVLVSDQDIENYNWTTQTITLTPQAANRLIWEKDKKENLFSNRISDKQFIVMLDWKRIYGWTILNPISARWIKYPVIYTNLETTINYIFDDISTWSVVLRLLPYPSIVTEYSDIPNEDKKVIEVDEIKNHFIKINKLVETIVWTLWVSKWNYWVIKNIFIPNLSENDIKNFNWKLVKVTWKPGVETWVDQTVIDWVAIQWFTWERNILKEAQIQLIEE